MNKMWEKSSKASWSEADARRAKQTRIACLLN